MSDELPLEIEVLEFVDLRTQGVETDFEIRVGEEAYKTHQETLMKHSEYFRGILNGENSVQKQQGFVNVENIAGNAVQTCLDYFYTGKVIVEAKSISDVIHAAEVFQLPKFEDFCFMVLEQALTGTNCISMYCSSKEKGNSRLADKAQALFSATFNFAEIDHFFQLSTKEMEDFVRSSVIGNDLLWTAIISWTEYDREIRKDDLPNMISLMEWEKFPSQSFLKELWRNPLFIGSGSCKAQVFQSLFMDLEKLEKSLTVDNFFIVQKISSEFMFLTKQTREVLLFFLALNVIELFERDEFVDLDEKFILCLYQTKVFRYVVLEEWRWIVAMKWVEHDQNRRKNFSQILATFRFDQMAVNFLEENVIKEISKHVEEFSTAFVEMATYSRAQRQRMNIALVLPDQRICIYDVTKGIWGQPVDEYHLESNLKLKRYRAFLRSPSVGWKELPTTPALQLPGIGNAGNDHFHVKALIYGKIEEGKVFDGSYSHVFLLSKHIVGLGLHQTGFGPHKNRLVATASVTSSDWRIGLFNQKSQCWEKNLWNTMSYSNSEEYVVIGNAIYLIAFSSPDRCHSVLKLTLVNGKIFKTTLPSLPEKGNERLLNVDGRLVALVNSNSIFCYDEMSKKWMKLGLPRSMQSNSSETFGMVPDTSSTGRLFAFGLTQPTQQSTESNSVKFTGAYSFYKMT